jgi:hypothetical protein
MSGPTNPPSGANVPTRNCFAPLSADSILAPLPVHAVPTIQTPGGWEAQFDTQRPDTPRPMSMVPLRPPTVLPQSPTVTLEPMQEPELYTYLDTTYGSLDEVLCQTAANASIPPNVLMWMKATITEVCAVQICTAYNQLSRKMYEHKASVDQALVNVHSAMDCHSFPKAPRLLCHVWDSALFSPIRSSPLWRFRTYRMLRSCHRHRRHST